MPRRIVLIAAAALALAAPAAASIQWDIQCNPAQTEFAGSVEIFNQYVEAADLTGYELLLEQSAIGTCDDPEIFMTVPLHPFLTWATYTFTRPVPETNQYYRFRVLLREPDGTVRDVSFPGAPSWIAVSCGEAVAVRGYLKNVNEYGQVEIELCPGACDTWPCTYAVQMDQIPEEQWLPLVGAQVAVDIYGHFIRYPMPGDGCLFADYWLPTAAEDCGAVPTEGESWGNLKARYR